jgi:aryl sulfotransferase
VGAPDAPNVHLFHYADYTADLVGEYQRLARILEYDRTRDRLAELAREARLDRMRERAVEVVPGAEHDHWKDPRRFFRTGGSGEWREYVDDDLERRYEERVEALTASDLARWAHAGGSFTGAPT